jgi:L-aspartate oxidase
MRTELKNSDFLVIGSGMAGLISALELSRYGTVNLITKRSLTDSNTNWAQGGIACVMDPGDSFEEHIQDTLNAGAGLCNLDAVKLVVHEGPRRIAQLIDYGVPFSSRLTDNGEASFDLGREGGHTQRRVMHAGDITGEQIQRVLVEEVRKASNVRCFEEHTAIDLITARRTLKRPGPDRCLGAYVLSHPEGRVLVFAASVTVLASGGSGKVYLYTSNPDVATGDGLAMAYRANASIANMEFIQFHPTCLYHPKAKSFLISEAVRGEGAVLINGDGESFMEKYHAMKSLAPRDVVARAIDNEMKRRGEECVYLDITHRPDSFIQARFPNIYETCLEFGFDMCREPIPVVPAAHYSCGGVVTDLRGRTDIPMLYACGEVACTGLHGANRLASNSLLEAMVMAHQVCQDLKENLYHKRYEPEEGLPPWRPGSAVDSDEQVVILHNWDEIRRFMWDYVGIVRTDKRLARAHRRARNILDEVEQYYWDFLINRDLLELRNLCLVGDLIIRSAQARKESRGLHYTLDYPESRDDLCVDTLIQKRPEVTASAWPAE